MRARIERGLAALGLTPPPQAAAQLEAYGRLLLEQNQVMNLTAITDPDQVVDLHFLDSAALLTIGTAFAGKTLIDVGTGAGFPGLPLKLLEPSLSVTLLDSLGKRVSWLEDVCKALSLDNVTCLHARAEEQARETGFRDSFDLAVSRAVASLEVLSELCLPYVKVGGKFLAMKSVDSGAETEGAARAIAKLGGRLLPRVDYTIPGTGIVHRVVAVEKVSPTPKEYPRRWAKIQKAPL
ncbi:16S rRNA (guanine(527)-N(7))-methyltransferase RsmG [uncultured Flavonifractor sp.]|uniref:16S rRNA (guanine(527)-N(7))-methyltransferase RsmG n=1 Tax=uncultured Flavonifractor sp. TaxID=1193534 RepID=UPI00261A0132|nr:16S rRNA (guanine(527)-N(7))-methyltransferase RsmG [uncultured Flavonifractor sp.]